MDGDSGLSALDLSCSLLKCILADECDMDA